MADQYHYDSEGNYTGKTSDTPPSSGGCGCAILIIIIILIAIGSKSGGGSSSGNAVTDSSEQETSVPEPQPDSTPVYHPETEPRLDSTPAYRPEPEPEAVSQEMSPVPEPITAPVEESSNSSDSGWIVPREE